MKRFLCLRMSSAVFVLALTFLCVLKAADAQWSATVGSQSSDASDQAMAFLPNEMWIFAGDSITWTTKSGENHTVTFLKQSSLNGSGAMGTNRPASAAGCSDGEGGSIYSASGSDTLTVTAGVTNCVNSGPICDPALQQAPEPAKCTGWTTGGANTVEKTFTVTFPDPGNFKLVCLIHTDMTGAIHVLDPAVVAALPHQQSFYDDEGRDQAQALISDTDGSNAVRGAIPNRFSWNNAGSENDSADNGDSSEHVVVTRGETVGYGGGKSYLAVMRFEPSTIHVNVNDTVEWVDLNASEPHTVTFGQEPLTPAILFGVTDADNDVGSEGTLPNVIASGGALLAGGACTVASPCANTFNSGIFGPAQQEISGTTQKAIAVNHVSVTFTKTGTYDYFCILHDELGMKGEVVVGSGKDDDQ